MDDKYLPSLEDELGLWAHIAEECGEVMAAYGKMNRFGPNSYNPELPLEQQESNHAWFKRECIDLKNALDRFLENYP